MEHAKPKKIKSKRLQRVLNKLSNPNTETEDSAEEAKKSSTRGRPAKRKADSANREDGETEVKDQSKRRGQRSKVTKTNNSTDEGIDSDVSEEYMPTGFMLEEVKGHPTRRSGRASKKVVSMDVGNSDGENRERENDIQSNLSKESAKVTEFNTKGAKAKTEGEGSYPGRVVKGRGRGKGRVGVKGKGKSLAKKGRGGPPAGRGGRSALGPKLSESSSDDSD